MIVRADLCSVGKVRRVDCHSGLCSVGKVRRVDCHRRPL